jgi:hypothetical protein
MHHQVVQEANPSQGEWWSSTPHGGVDGPHEGQGERRSSAPYGGGNGGGGKNKGDKTGGERRNKVGCDDLCTYSGKKVHWAKEYRKKK